jgi:hypothetical protein
MSPRDPAQPSRAERRHEAQARESKAALRRSRKHLGPAALGAVAALAIVRTLPPKARRMMWMVYAAEFVVIGPIVHWVMNENRMFDYREAQLDRADDQLDLADAQLDIAADLHAAVTAMDRQTTRLQNVAIIVGIATGLIGAVLGGFAGAWAATVMR